MSADAQPPFKKILGDTGELSLTGSVQGRSADQRLREEAAQGNGEAQSPSLLGQLPVLPWVLQEWSLA